MSQQHSQLLLGECGVQGQALLGLRLVGHGRQEGHPEDLQIMEQQLQQQSTLSVTPL